MCFSPNMILIYGFRSFCKLFGFFPKIIIYGTFKKLFNMLPTGIVFIEGEEAHRAGSGANELENN